VQDHEGGAGPVAVGEVGRGEHGEEGEEVRRGRQRLGRQGGVAHIEDDGGQEDGQRAEGYVAGEEHELWKGCVQSTCVLGI